MCTPSIPKYSIRLNRDFNKWLHTEQNEWIYTLKYVYIHLYVVVHLKSLKRQIFRNGGSNIYFFRYCTDSGTHRVLRILRMDLFLFNFLYEVVATLQVMCTLYMQLTFNRGTIIQAINSNGLDVTNIKSISNSSRQISSRFLKRRTTSNASGIHFHNSKQPDEIRANTNWFHISMKDFV